MSSGDSLFDELPRHVTLATQIACVEREIKMRERCYPRWVEDGVLSAGRADGELAAMRAVLDSLRYLRERTELVR